MANASENLSPAACLRDSLEAIRKLGHSDTRIAKVLHVGDTNDLREYAEGRKEGDEKLAALARRKLPGARMEPKVRRLIQIGYHEADIAAEIHHHPSVIARLLGNWECSLELETAIDGVWPRLVADRLDEVLRLHGADTWSARREKQKPEEKQHMVSFWARREFLVRDRHLGRPEATAEQRETVASILVNQGTTPNAAVAAALDWIRVNNRTHGPFDLTWYTSGTLVADTLRQFQKENPFLSCATRLFLFPGMVNLETEAVSGSAAVDFADKLERRFTYAILSAYAFDITDGTVYFYQDDEVPLQRACATRYAEHKFLFLDSSKFKREGTRGYGLGDLLAKAAAVTIYTVSVSPEKDELLKGEFRALCEKLLNRRPSETAGSTVEHKCLTLRIVGESEKENFESQSGVLNEQKPEPKVPFGAGLGGVTTDS